MALRILIGKPPVINKMKQWPHERFIPFFFANSMRCWSFPMYRTSAGPDDSQNARPNFMFGFVDTTASYKSSTVLMKCDWPRMQFMSAGLSMVTLLSSMGNSLQWSVPSKFDKKPSKIKQNMEKSDFSCLWQIIYLS